MVPFDSAAESVVSASVEDTMDANGLAREPSISSEPGDNRDYAKICQFDAAAARQIHMEFRELAHQIFEVAAAIPGVAGVRLWQIADGEPTVWQESGILPLPDKIAIEGATSAHASAGTEVYHWVCPVRCSGDIVGVLEFCSPEPMGKDARNSLENLARVASAAWNNTIHRQVAEELSAIVLATKLLNSTLDLGELIKIILQLATRLTGAERGTVFLVNREQNEIWSLVGLGLEEQEIRLPIDRGVAGWVARHAESVRLENVYADPRFEPTVDRRLAYRTRNLLGLPIRSKDGEILGVLELINRKEGSFSAADEDSLNHLSDHVALALENARLYRELLAKQRMERDLEVARNVQRGLLPERPPDLAGFEISVAYKPSQMVGGDYYDFVPLNPRALLIVIADVEGKGLASALMMANLQATLHTLTVHVHPLEQIVKSVNDMIFSDRRRARLVSMFVAILDQQHRALHYINAGHVPPALIRVDGETVELRNGGTLVGAFPDATFTRGYIELSEGDVLAGYTDGITEAMDAEGNQYGLERLVNMVRRERTASAERIVETALAEVESFSRGSPLDDDRVIFILKVL